MAPLPTPENPYFDLNPSVRVSSLEQLLNLNRRRRFFGPGQCSPQSHDTALHYTCGCFRGQSQNWALVPKAWRKVSPADPTKERDAEIVRRTDEALFAFEEFCRCAAEQNPEFPDDRTKRMCIAQHFGIPTPLLDWTRNIFVALHFAIFEAMGVLGEPSTSSVYVYHIVDERLYPNRPVIHPFFENLDHAKFVAPQYLDRRMERQRGVFTHHLDPLKPETKVPVDVYEIGCDLYPSINELMRGMGLIEHFYFPDLGAIATSILKQRARLFT